ncbi:uncharacterized protein LOC135699620 [Ochlerotatus camptorhynchus]|uniref:uncharacterized protein LOC135699620 n=1 Tax=Ochlerotatus camptorhynchus TaxID=644619 RepID=UPI0031D93F1F
MSFPSIPHCKLCASDSLESCEPPYPSIEPIKPPRPSATPDHHGILHELTFHAVHSRLLEIDLKMSRLESNFHDAFSRLESSVARCHRTLEQVNESLCSSLNSAVPGASSSPRDMVVKMKFGRKEQKHLAPHSISDANQVEQFLTSPSTSLRGNIVERRRSSVLSRIKHHVKGAFSLPCVVTPVFEIYPPNINSKAVKHPPPAAMTTDLQPQ